MSSERTDAIARYWMLYAIFSLSTCTIQSSMVSPPGEVAETQGLEQMPHQIQAAILDDLLRRNAARRACAQFEEVARIPSSLTLQMNMLTVRSKCGRRCGTACNP
jgi:hypothetical protein